MDIDNYSGLTMSTLLKGTWHVWRSNARIFVFLMGLVIASFFVMALVMNYAIAPHAAGVSLREVWQHMGVLQKLAVLVLFFLTFAVHYRALAASAFATQEIWNGRSVDLWSVIKSVRRKQLRLFWLVFLASTVTGRFAFIVAPILLFATAPGFPVAILEGKTAIAAVKRGDTLMKQDQRKIAILVLLWLGTVVVAVIGWVSFLMFLEDQFGQPWYLRPVPAIGFWLILLIPQLYMVAITLLYLDRNKKEINNGTSQ